MSVQSASYETKRMKRFIKKELAKMDLGHTCDSYGNIYVTKGDADLYPTMVCHIDTVHEINDDVKVIQVDDKLLAIDTTDCKRYGIGGDDKVGIYITLQMLKHFDNFKAVFFLDEEVGCVGSSQADFTFFDDSTIVLECDRKGINDFVTSITGTTLSDDTLHQDIDHILTKYNRRKVNGGITDVGEIAEKNTVQVANMSCGYYDPHTANEYIIISEVESTKQMCIEILTATMDKRYEMNIKDRITYHSPSMYNYNHWSYQKKNQPVINPGIDIWDDYGYEKNCMKLENTCPCCNAQDVWYDDYEQDYYCLNCHKYVDIDSIKEPIVVDDMHMANITESEYIKADTELYNASFSKAWKKNVEPKHITK